MQQGRIDKELTPLNATPGLDPAATRPGALPAVTPCGFARIEHRGGNTFDLAGRAVLQSATIILRASTDLLNRAKKAVSK